MASTKGKTARERLLAAADELFYTHGVQSVGVDLIAKRAGSSKKSLYAIFGSKGALVLSYLEARQDSIQKRIMSELRRFDTPRERLLGIFDIVAEFFTGPDYHGCPFLSASVGSAIGSPIDLAHAKYRTWVRTLVTDLAAQTGVSDPEKVGREIHLLYDAANVAFNADRDPSAAFMARAAAIAVLDHGKQSADN
ncbi:TetR/AcrR family transcriptional regulator [Streptomyces sp. NPDC054770]